MADSGGGGKVHTTDRSLPYKQDTAPKGGYKPITYSRMPARQLVTAPILFGGFWVAQAFGFYLYSIGVKRLRYLTIEAESAAFALTPLLLAERDREYLKHLRRHRDYEKELMKDVPGWQVGTWFGQKVFKTTTDEMPLERMSRREFYASARPYQRISEMNYKEWLVC